MIQGGRMSGTAMSDYLASLARIEKVAEVFRGLPSTVLLSEQGSDADMKWGIDGWLIVASSNISFGIGTQRGNWKTITITGRRSSGHPSTEARMRERIKNGEPYPKLTITAYGEAVDPAAPYTALYAVRMVNTAELHSLPDDLWQEKPIRSRADEGNMFKFISVKTLRAHGVRVVEWEPATGWTFA